MKTTLAGTGFVTGSVTVERWQTLSSPDRFFQGPVAFRHQNEKDRVGHAEQRGERDVRQAALHPVIERRPRVSQFVKRANEDQIRVPTQVTTRNQEVSNANYHHKDSQQREVAAKS